MVVAVGGTDHLDHRMDRNNLARREVLGWTAPNGIAMCQREFVEDSIEGDRPWRILHALGWTRQRAYSNYME